MERLVDPLVIGVITSIAAIVGGGFTQLLNHWFRKESVAVATANNAIKVVEQAFAFSRQSWEHERTGLIKRIETLEAQVSALMLKEMPNSISNPEG
jgi:hypothetical protein